MYNISSKSKREHLNDEETLSKKIYTF